MHMELASWLLFQCFGLAYSPQRCRLLLNAENVALEKCLYAFRFLFRYCHANAQNVKAVVSWIAMQMPSSWY